MKRVNAKRMNLELLQKQRQVEVTTVPLRRSS